MTSDPLEARGRATEAEFALLDLTVDGALFDRLAAIVREYPGAALFGVADKLALQIRDGLAARRLGVPEHYSLAGFDATADRLLGHPAGITSVGYARVTAGATALRLLRTLCDQPTIEQQYVRMRPTLTIGPSTRARGAALNRPETGTGYLSPTAS